MMRRWIVPLGLLGLACTLGVRPGWTAPDAGSEPALYLGAGARAVALGRTGVTDTQTPFAADWNPAGLGYLNRTMMGVQHAELFAGARMESLGIAYPVLDWGAPAFSLNRIDVGDIERRTADNRPDGSFGMAEQQFALSYGRVLAGWLSAGLTAKVHHLRLDDRESLAPGLDAGVLATWTNPLGDAAEAAWLRRISAGCVVRNVLGPRLTLAQTEDPLFPAYRTGVALDLDLLPDFPNHLLLRAEAEKPERAGWRFHAGAEWALFDLLALRGGWDEEYVSVGAGVTWGGFTLDYALSFPELGLRHLMTLTVAVGPDLRDLAAQRAADEERKRQEVVEKLKQRMIDDYRMQALQKSREGDFEAAAALWQRVLDWDPQHAEARTAMEALRKKIVDAQNARQLESARAYLADNQYIDVMVECRSILERTPDHSEAAQLYRQAEKQASRLGEGPLTENVKTLQRIREDYLQGLKAYTSQNWSAAIRHWENVIANSPLQKQVYQYLEQATRRLSRDKQPAAEQPATPTKKKVLFQKAVTLSKQGDLKQAVETWENLVKENPEDQEVKENFEKTRQDLIDSQKKGIRW